MTNRPGVKKLGSIHVKLNGAVFYSWRGKVRNNTGITAVEMIHGQNGCCHVGKARVAISASKRGSC